MPLVRFLACTVLLTATAAAADEPAAAEQLRDLGGLVMPIAQSDPRLDVALHLADKPVDDGTIDLIVILNEKQPADAKIAWLNLAGSAITDAGCEKLAKLTGLQRLHLERTAVTDGGLAKLAPLKQLTYLNLYGTKVSNEGLATLKTLPKLKKAFVWQTAVTNEAIASFRKSHPSVDLVGEVKLQPITFETDEAKDGAKDKPEKAATKKAAEPEPANKKPADKKPAGTKEKTPAKPKVSPGSEKPTKDGKGTDDAKQ